MDNERTKKEPMCVRDVCVSRNLRRRIVILCYTNVVLHTRHPRINSLETSTVRKRVQSVFRSYFLKLFFIFCVRNKEVRRIRC